MNAEDATAVADAWICRTREHADKEYPESSSSDFILDNLCHSDPSLAVDIILSIVKRFDETEIFGNDHEHTRNIIANLAAGPIEDLLVYHGPDVIARIEAEARLDRRVAWALGNVWRNNISDDVWDRLRRVAIID